MRAAKIVIWVLCFSAAGFAQQPSSNPPTLVGCLISLNGSFVLTTRQGDRYILKGHHNTVLRHNGQQVKVTGPPPSARNSTTLNPGEFQVQTITKLSDVCH